MKRLSVFNCLLIILLLASTKSYAQFSFQNEPLPNVIKEIQFQTGYRFLYREAQVGNITVSFESSHSDFVDSLQASLNPKNISLSADSSRKQIILYRRNQKTSGNLTISGQIVDAETGERLPYATIFWNESNAAKGVTSNSSGFFNISTTSPEQNFTLSASYLGFETTQIVFDLSKAHSYPDVTIRLQPSTFRGHDIVVTGFTYTPTSDSLYRNFVNAGVLNPFGENNMVRALQSLPSVNSGTAINNGINVRGSSADATQILLDGISIYNQSHLFGLLDSFNPSALQTSGFFYDVTPAQFQSTPGGTISMLTKTGSLNNFTASSGLSNTAFNSTLHGPLFKGNSSWFFSGRTSYLNQIDWFHNNRLIAYGLNIDRPKEVLADNQKDLESQLVFPNTYDASFFDLHGKLYFEFEEGSRFIVSSYYGGDNVSQNADRRVRYFDSNNPSQRFRLQQVETQNQWGNFSSSLAFKSPVTPAIYSHSLAAISIYNTEFIKDDFVYNRVQPGPSRNVQVFTFPLHNQSIFNEIKFDQSFDIIRSGFQYTVGLSYQYFMGEYFEESFDRPGFLTRFSSDLIDAYAQMDFTSFTNINIHAGSRFHYYSNGDYLLFSPRLKIKFLETKPISFGIGYSRNFQFTHRLSFYNVSSPDVWIISTDQQPPTSSNYYSTGLYIKTFPNMFIQVEGYYKDLENVRIYDLNTQTLTSSFDAPPWLYNNNGTSKGIEILLKNYFNRFTLTNSYALSEAIYQNPDILEGEEFYAAWDRTHTFSSMFQFQVVPSLKIHGSIVAASGMPNRLHFLQLEDQERLGNYYRVDTGVEFRTTIDNTELEFNFSIYNLLNRENPWYRELNLVIDTSLPANQRRLSSQAMDVYDLGIQPSFSLIAWF